MKQKQDKTTLSYEEKKRTEYIATKGLPHLSKAIEATYKMAIKDMGIEDSNRQREARRIIMREWGSILSQKI